MTNAVLKKVYDLEQSATKGTEIFAQKVAQCESVEVLNIAKDTVNSGSGGGTTEEKIHKLSGFIFEDVWRKIEEAENTVSSLKHEIHLMMEMLYANEFLKGGNFDNAAFRRLVSLRVGVLEEVRRIQVGVAAPSSGPVSVLPAVPDLDVDDMDL